MASVRCKYVCRQKRASSRMTRGVISTHSARSRERDTAFALMVRPIKDENDAGETATGSKKNKKEPTRRALATNTSTEAEVRGSVCRDVQVLGDGDCLRVLRTSGVQNRELSRVGQIAVVLSDVIPQRLGVGAQLVLEGRSRRSHYPEGVFQVPGGADPGDDPAERSARPLLAHALSAGDRMSRRRILPSMSDVSAATTFTVRRIPHMPLPGVSAATESPPPYFIQLAPRHQIRISLTIRAAQ